ncbi:alpha/beta-hydrolase [Vararia minispora EC-137]|uniref:Alpha/beta-hydrolase n=1 Tax=Vararia minispora EC-137 TaxID=1314806 RepID=A0ACB8QVL8_9AGAM|nr:alpha/beta-hydrolase [Vararia minispora EC-137]
MAPKRRPLVLWHGMGDSYASEGMLEFAEMIKGVHDGIFVHSIYLDENLDEDRRAGFYGNVNDQVESVATQLANITELADGFDAIGFSQGGQFLRAYVERFNAPRVHNLLTFGSQHMGVSDVADCRPLDVLCQIARRAARNGAYTEWAQEHLVQAQYYRDPKQLTHYLEMNHFLASINNEVLTLRNVTYAKNLAALENLVLILFSRDGTVVPKESSWFGSYAPDSAGDETVVAMRQQPLYTEDWIGLRTLDERGAVVLETCEGGHMAISECWQPLIEKYTGSIVS